MNTKKLLQLLIVIVLLFASFVVAGRAEAVSQCASTIVVQWGDTLSGIAAYCGTTVDAIRAANPSLGWWLYAGQTLNIPTGSNPSQPPITGGTYVVQAGDTLKIISARAGVTIESILAANPEIVNMNLIYVGQVIKMPAASAATPVPGVATATPVPGTVPTVVAQPTFPAKELAYVPLTITYKYGMYVRSEPNGKIVASPPANEVLYYRPGSDVSDRWGRIWVEVRLYPPRQGYTTGWVMVRDQYGTFYTKPRFRANDPSIIPPTPKPHEPYESYP